MCGIRELKEGRGKTEFVRAKGGVGSYAEISPAIPHPLAPKLEDPDPKAEALLLRRLQLAFLPI